MILAKQTIGFGSTGLASLTDIVILIVEGNLETIIQVSTQLVEQLVPLVLPPVHGALVRVDLLAIHA